MNEESNTYIPLLDQLKQIYPNALKDVPIEKFKPSIDSFMKARNWVLKKYNIINPPILNLGEIKGQEGVTGFIKTEDGKSIINLDPVLFSIVAEVPDASLACVRYQQAGFTTLLSLEQWFEAIGVEETTHYAQDLGLCKTTFPEYKDRLLPNSESTNDITYALQPHEVEAALVRDEYFMQMYGKDHPLYGYVTQLIQLANINGKDIFSATA